MGPELHSPKASARRAEPAPRPPADCALQSCTAPAAEPAQGAAPGPGPAAPLAGPLAVGLFGHYAAEGPKQSAPQSRTATGHPRPEPVPDPESTEARASARELRAALIAQVSLDAVMRLLNRHPERVRAAVGAYDAELSVTGGGLVADVDRMFGAAHAEVAAALLARAGAEPRQALTYTRSAAARDPAAPLRIVPSPRVSVAVPGTQIRYSVDQGERMYSAGSYCTYQWFCLNDPQTSQAYDLPELVWGPGTPSWDTRWQVPGNHKVLCRILFRAREPDGGYTDHPPQYVEFQQCVQSQGDVLAGAIDAATGRPRRAAPAEQLRILRGYQQALHTAEQQPGSGPLEPKKKESLDRQITKLQERLASTEGHARIPLAAAHVTAENARVSSLNVFLSHVGSSGGQEVWKLIDITNPADRRLSGEYTGRGRDAQHAIQDAVSAWDRGNRYPKGRLRVQVPGEAGAQLDQEFQTDGASFWDSVSEFFGQVGFWSGIGLLGAAAVMAIAPDPTVSKVAAALLWTSILSGTAGASIGIAQRHAEGMSTATEDAFDTLTIVGNILGARWALGATVKGLSLAGSRAGTAVVVGRVTTDSAQGVLLSAEYVKEYREILDDADPQRRTDRMLQLLGKAALSGGLLTLSLQGSRADLARLKQSKASLSRLGSAGEVIDLSQASAENAAHAETEHSFGSAPTLPQIAGGKGQEPKAVREHAHASAVAEPVQAQDAQPVAASKAAGQTSSGWVTEPVPGLYESIDAEPGHAPPGWWFHDEVKPIHDGWLRIKTHCRDANGNKGQLTRSYDPKTKMYVMEAAFFDDKLERWIHEGVPMVPGRGTPLATYLMLRQLKRVGAAYGEVQTVKMSTIQNVEAILQLEQNIRQGMKLEEAVRLTHSVQYAETAMTQAGHRIVEVRVKLNRATRSPLDEMLGYYEQHRNLDGERDPAVVAKHEALLAKYGVRRTDSVLWNYDIYLDLAPFAPGTP